MKAIENNPFHTRAMSFVTNEWQRFPTIREASGLHFNVYQDLIWEGRIEERREQVERNGRQMGERIYLRLARPGFMTQQQENDLLNATGDNT